MKKLLFTLTLLVTANSAFAWGDFERGITTGLAGAWLYNRLTQPVPNTVYVEPQPTIVVPRQIHQPPPTVYYNTIPYCRNVPVTDYYGRVIGYQQVCD